MPYHLELSKAIVGRHRLNQFAKAVAGPSGHRCPAHFVLPPLSEAKPGIAIFSEVRFDAAIYLFAHFQTSATDISSFGEIMISPFDGQAPFRDHSKIPIDILGSVLFNA